MEKRKTTRGLSRKTSKNTDISDEGTPDIKGSQAARNIQTPRTKAKSKVVVPESEGSNKHDIEECTEEQSQDAADGDESDDNVQVCVRVRPLLKDERDRKETYSWSWENKSITQTQFPKRRNHSAIARSSSEPAAVSSAAATASTYTFDHLYTPEHSNEDIFSSVVQKIVLKAMRGYHGSVFTYGQTSSGKTFTMNGTAKQPGLIPQAIYMCFDSVAQFREREFLFRVSYLEVYNETVHDLLSPDIAQIRIIQQTDPKAGAGTILTGVKEQVVMNPEQVIALLQGGEAYRHVGTTDMNQKSSRAHTLFKLIIESKALAGEANSAAAGSSAADPIRVSTLNLVDLAGSENAKMTNSKGERAREARHINQSLLTLSTIIHRLCDEAAATKAVGGNKPPQHLPYRDSKLTRILQTALSGNSLIGIICTISPTAQCAEESNNTLKFASRAKTIRTDAKVNESMDDKTLLRAYRQEIEDLKAKLQAMESMMHQGRVEQGNEGEGDALEVDTDNELIMLQMIEHMERLILKGEEQAKRESSGSGAGGGKGPRSSTARRPSGLPRKKSSGAASNGFHRSQSASSVPNSSSVTNSSKKQKQKQIPLAEQQSGTGGGVVAPCESVNNDSVSIDGRAESAVAVDRAEELSRRPEDKNTVIASAPISEKLSTVAQRKKDIEMRLSAASATASRPLSSSPPTSLSVVAVAGEERDGGGASGGERSGGSERGSDTEDDGSDDEGDGGDFFAGRSPRPSAVYSRQKRDKEQQPLADNGGERDGEDGRRQSAIARKSLSWASSSSSTCGADGNDGREIVSSQPANDLDSYQSPAGPAATFSSSSSSHLEDFLALHSPRRSSLQLAAVASRGNSSAPPGTKALGGDSTLKDPVLEGVSQMLQILKLHVNKHSKTPIRSLMMSMEQSQSPWRESGAQKKADDLSADEMATELKLKEADNKNLQAEVVKLRDNLADKESMLAMLTDGLKEVEVNQEQMLAANSSLSTELDLMHKAYAEVEEENQMLRSEVSRLVACLEAREKQFFEVTGRTREEEEF